jgi:hypothetical protein
MMEAGMDVDPDGKASWHCGRVEIHCCTHPLETTTIG